MHLRATLLVCLFLVVPAQAEEGQDPEPASPEGGGSGASTNETQGSSEPCELVDWWTSNPGQITVDPDQCYVPGELRPIISKIPGVT